MLEELYKIFKECFPTTLISKEEFEKKLDFNDSEVIKEYDENGMFVGEGPLMKDLVEISDKDFHNVNYTSIAIILIIMVYSVEFVVLMMTVYLYASWIL